MYYAHRYTQEHIETAGNHSKCEYTHTYTQSHIHTHFLHIRMRNLRPPGNCGTCLRDMSGPKRHAGRERRVSSSSPSAVYHVCVYICMYVHICREGCIFACFYGTSRAMPHPSVCVFLSMHVSLCVCAYTLHISSLCTRTLLYICIYIYIYI